MQRPKKQYTQTRTESGARTRGVSVETRRMCASASDALASPANIWQPSKSDQKQNRRAVGSAAGAGGSGAPNVHQRVENGSGWKCSGVQGILGDRLS